MFFKVQIENAAITWVQMPKFGEKKVNIIKISHLAKVDKSVSQGQGKTQYGKIIKLFFH